MALTLRRRPNDHLRLWQLSQAAQAARVLTIVTNDVLYHEPSRRLLQDVVTRIKAMMQKQGVPAEFLNGFTGLEPFPGLSKGTHALETDSLKMNPPLEQSEWTSVQQRERHTVDAIHQGARPAFSDIVDYIYGKGRMRGAPSPS